MKLRVELYIYNLFNSSTVTNKYQDMLHDEMAQLDFANDTDIFKGFNTECKRPHEPLASPLCDPNEGSGRRLKTSC